ncbi:MAG: hypothetical protein AAGB51_07490 [Planctomycetota bacterium]
MKHAATAAVLAAAGLASGAHAQVFEIVPDQGIVDVTSGPVDVMFSLYIDSQGAPLIDLGGAGLQPFSGWSSFTGSFGATGGEFQAVTEGVTDSSLGPWMGRRPGSVAGVDGSFGSFRFANLPAFGQQVVMNGGLTLTGAAGALSGGQKQTVLGGTGQNNSGRLEVFRGVIRFDDSDLGDQQITFAGNAGFFLDPTFLTTASTSLASTGGAVSVVPAPGAVVLMSAGGLAIARRRRA